MPKWIPISLIPGAATCLCLMLKPEIASGLLDRPMYLLSIMLYALSASILASRECEKTLISPSLFLLLFFLAVPVLGTAHYRRALESGVVPAGRSVADFAFPTCLCSVGTVSFYGGVVIAWYVVPRPDARYAVLG